MQQRSSVWARTAGIALVAWLAVPLASCATPSYRYVGSSDRDVVFRVPSSWTAVNTKEALKASGVDPATATGWAAFYDAAPRPSPKHGQAGSAADPVLRAQSFDIPAADRETLTDDQLRELVLPGTAEARAAALVSKQFQLLTDKPVATKAQHGAHVLFLLKTDDGQAEYYDQIALTDPKRTRVHVVTVHCTQQCYKARSREINDVVTSLTLKSH